MGKALEKDVARMRLSLHLGSATEHIRIITGNGGAVLQKGVCRHENLSRISKKPREEDVFGRKLSKRALQMSARPVGKAPQIGNPGQ